MAVAGHVVCGELWPRDEYTTIVAEAKHEDGS
jgi:hypothetical protein